MTDIIQVTSLLITISALFAYINHRFIGLPTTIGVMIVALSMSVIVYLLGQLGFADFEAEVSLLLSGIDFNKTLMQLNEVAMQRYCNSTLLQSNIV